MIAVKDIDKYCCCLDGKEKRHISPIRWDEKGEEIKESSKKSEKTPEGEKKGKTLFNIDSFCLSYLLSYI